MYNKKDAVMTHGFAIICMVVLHLFCRLGDDVLGTPLIWINDTTPLVYYFGFFAEICVPLYALTAGYAQQLMINNGRSSYKGNLKRAFNLLINYWIVLVIFSILGLIFQNETIPGNAVEFILNIFLIHSYNGAWWFLKTYIILMIIPIGISLFPVKKIKNVWVGIVLCLGIDIAWYLVNKLGLVPGFENSSLLIVINEIKNLIDVIPFFWVGAILCKFNAVTKAKEFIDKFIKVKYQKAVLIIGWIGLFIITIVLHKAAFMGVAAIGSFMLLNLIKKSSFTEKILTLLGKHSTNIWLTHMFFYLVLFVGLVEIVKYPIFMLIFMFALCIAVSYVVMGIQKLINKITEKCKE